jgi:hypothetical protein
LLSASNTASPRELTPVVVEGGLREVSLFRLDARPLDRQSIRAESELGQQRNVIRVSLELITCVAGGLGEGIPLGVFEQPEAATGVVALDLMGRRRGPPYESIGKRNVHVRDSWRPTRSSCRLRF